MLHVRLVLPVISYDCSCTILKHEICVLQRMLLFQLKNEMVAPFGETVQQVFARISALRDALDGPQVGPPTSK